MKKFLSLFLSVSMLVSIVGCGTKSNVDTPTNSIEATQEASIETQLETETAATTEVTQEDVQAGITLTDMGGREVILEKPIERAYASNLIGILYLRTLDISKIGGWTNPLSDDEKQFIPEQYQNLPMLGGWSSANPTANVEELVNANIDVIFVTAIVNPKAIDMADNIQSQTGIPTIIVSSDIHQLAEAYELMGKALNQEERAAELAAYCTAELAEVQELVANIPEEDRVRFYYAEGDAGLETDPTGSMHTQAFDFVNAINVADIDENTANGLVGQSTVSLEQVMTWNPEFIIRNSTYTAADPTKGANEILDNPDWANIDAVKNKKVYQTPALPNNWIDRAPSVNRVLGVKWLANLFYPDVVKYDIHAEAKEFFQLFYGIDLTDEQLNQILAASESK